MEIVFAILAVAGIWLAPSLVVLLVAMSAHRRVTWLSRRVGELQRQLDVLQGSEPAVEHGAPDLMVEAPQADPWPDVPDVPEAPVLAPTAEPVDELPEQVTEELPILDLEPEPVGRRTPAWPSPERLVVWVAATLGGLALVVAALLALVVVIERGWVGPAARVGGGLVFGIGLWAAGAVLRTRAPWPSSALAGAGAGTLYGALYGASGLYGLVPSTLAGVGMVAVTTVAMFRAVRLSDRFVAHLGLAGGLLTPMLVSSGSDDVLSMFAYLALLTAGVSAVAVRKGWWDLLGAAAIGDTALFALWAFSAYTPDQAGIALLGAAAMALPLGVAAASPARRVHITAALGSLLLGAVALPWIVPIDAVFVDPRTAERLVRPSSSAQLWAALAVGWWPLVLWTAGRVRGGWSASWGTVAAVVGVVTYAGAWGAVEDPVAVGAIALVVALVVPLGVAALVGLGARSPSRAMLPVLVAVGLALSLALPVLSGGPFALVAAALVLAGALVARSSGHGVAPALLTAGAAIALWAAGFELDRLGPWWVSGAAVLTLAVVGPGSVRTPWSEQARWAWATAGVVAVVVFSPLYGAWMLAWGDAVVGVLPLALAAVVLACAAVLVRQGRLGLDDAVTAVLVGVVLLGVTAAVPLQLQERWLTVAWGLEAAALAVASRRVRHPLIGISALALCAAVGVRLLANPWALAWGDATGLPIFNWTLYSWGIPLLCVLVVARWLPRPDGATDPFAWVPAPLGALAIAIGFALVNVQVSHGFADAGPLELGGTGRMEGMVRSIAWAAYGIGILGLGLARDHRWVRLAGFGVVMLATAKVFTVDVWDLSGFVRVASVGGLAVALLMAAFLFERLVIRGARFVEES